VGGGRGDWFRTYTSVSKTSIELRVIFKLVLAFDAPVFSFK